MYGHGKMKHMQSCKRHDRLRASVKTSCSSIYDQTLSGGMYLACETSHC